MVEHYVAVLVAIRSDANLCSSNLSWLKMLQSLRHSLQITAVVGGLIVVAFLTISIMLRQRDIQEESGAESLEATYHVLLTVEALAESPLSSHHLLPIVSFGSERDKEISWGATVRTEAGDYIYTSFTPPGFLAPYFVFSTFEIAPSRRSLALFNVFLGVVSSLIQFAYLRLLLSAMGKGCWTAAFGAALGTTIGIFSREALLSHGVVYWSHCLYQVLMAASLWAVVKYLCAVPRSNVRRIYAVVIVSLAFCGAMTEWTGYIFNAGLVVLFWVGSKELGRSKWPAFAIVAATVCAVACTVVHYGFTLGFQRAVVAFLYRFLARSTSAGSFAVLARGYLLSFGLFLVALSAAVVMLCFLWARLRATTNIRGTHVAWFVVIAAVFPMLENVVLLQHASQFSYDRLKFIFPAGILIAITFSVVSAQSKILVASALLVCCVDGYRLYRNDMHAHREWLAIDHNNKVLVRRISEKVDMRCAVFLSNIAVRGYANLLLHRGIYEVTPVQESSELIKKRDACSAVYLEGISAYTDLPKFTSAVITHKDGSREVIRVE